MKRLKIFLLLLVAYAAEPVRSQSRFTDITKQAGIDHVFKVYEGLFGGGACVIDFNNDGFEDVYITGGMNDDVLYKNNGNGTFTNVFSQSGLTATRKYVTQGVASADVNRDGFVDLFITTITSRGVKQAIPREINLFFINNGNGTFRDATREFGLDQELSFSTSVSFGDFNADGWPDIYVANYFNEFKGELSAVSDADVVGANQTAKGFLLRNEGGKKFTDVSDQYGIDFTGYGFGGIFTDYDNDGDQDLLINHDFGFKRKPNVLLENRYPRRSFREVSKESGMDLKINSMGAAVGDYNNDGLMDYYVTNIRFNYFMVNQGVGKPFVNKAVELGVDFHTISWGANFADFDQDGDLDLYVANGDLNPNCVAMADFYFDNLGQKFQDNARAAGLADYGIGRGSVVFDYDRDGDLDLLVVNQESLRDYPVPSFTRLYRNDGASGNWLQVALKGVKAESHGIGSRVEVEAGGKKMIREIDGGASSHLSQNSVIAHFGLGKTTKIDRLTVIWTGGNRQVLTDVKTNQLITITEVPEKKLPYWVLLMAAALLIGVIGFFMVRRRRSRNAGV
ncbi:CRTAC1 family protein [Flavihumibacter stibioxidans]|uniref:ASPIC/UnbV domain-containing protein n=1 Tax=Flavihumibacter stibioxidans TaxID=1834163 RepID=A0ABR7MAB2_9BACT|nr:CRTAC1 family protein [Flavihumibacter stibioxidans]MBC6491956.1 hypothetical protein [Flavihumibacter stibioxidans]